MFCTQFQYLSQCFVPTLFLCITILSGKNSLFLPCVSWAEGMSRWKIQPKLVCSLFPGIPETIPKEKIVARNESSVKSQTALPILGSDLDVPYELILVSLGRGAFQALKMGLKFFFNHNEHFSNMFLLAWTFEIPQAWFDMLALQLLKGFRAFCSLV